MIDLLEMHERYDLSYPTIEQSAGMTMSRLSRPGKHTTVLKEGYFYLGTYLEAGPYDTTKDACTLLVRRAQRRRGPSGKEFTVIDTDALVFPNTDWMLAWIKEHSAEELPPEADGNPHYVPEGY